MKFNRLLAAAAVMAVMAGTAEARELSMGSQDNENSNLYKGMVAFQEKLAEVSGGELTVKLFPASQLGDFKAMVAMLQAGELDLATTGYPDMSYVIPELKLIGAPYVVSDFPELERIVNGPWGQKMEAKFEDEGVKVVDLWYYGTRQTTANRPINAMDDLKGLRMRTPNVPFLIAYAKAVGATPAPVAFAEVYLALQTNQVDAEENPLPTIEAMKFYEVQSAIAITNHFIASQAIQVSLDTWDSLNEQEQGWVVEAAKAGGEVNDELTFSSEASLMSKFKDLGLTITEPDLTPFRAAMQPYYDELEVEFGKGAIAEVRGE
ncbi:sialic acid TRAP transporter substrate-binding protein SiaP [Martelella mediterranea]|uniref:sialic acid TRAP transporter substrate-binding protein SiaP n=1 Tax=Martelella mediterranea TaxID=293089 RepID=UPI001E4D9D87|nr:sialic acid TRAP transporter substrate-binding protein SiaP [Martelella mediterranea]MCD1636807.1 sialic acid TRAP transporter substrate-binding protein SiaP [Martelella mediterranea]